VNIHFNEVGTTSTAMVVYKPTESQALAKSSKSSLAKRACSAYKRSLENQNLNTYKALHLGGEETLMSKIIRSVATRCPTHTEEETAQRLSNYDKASKFLGGLTDNQLSTLLSSAQHLGSGTGGEVLSLEVEGVKLFIKKIRLTAIEQQNPRSTQNHFELPLYYQYGVGGSMGFGVWRDISAHEMTTKWVLNGECQNFPIMYHSRVLQRETLPTAPTIERLAERQGYIENWDGSVAVGKRDEAIEAACADVVVFMEHLPQTLHTWLRTKGNLTEESITRVDRELNLVTTFMKSRGFLHFDAHLRNIQATDNHIYFADFGLATSLEFDLAPDERAFFEKHRDYDRYSVLWRLAGTAITATLTDEESEVLLKKYQSTEKMTLALPQGIGAIAERYRPIATLMANFFKGLQDTSKSTPYPEAELAHEWSKIQHELSDH
jgi:hypothetical protein